MGVKMNIKEAKDEIKRTVEIYLDKNEFGEYSMPEARRRPVFMAGAPGIGKCASVQQIAAELDIAFVSCSMAHHTRQSALGRPVLEERDYEGKHAVISEYTMSGIIAAVYDVMRDSGKKEGILFLDEVNCVSEAMLPAMLMFLRYKIFGNQKVPEGWVVVTAGSLLKYNKSAREFDVSTLNRLKRIIVEEDFSAWERYAYRQGMHAAVIMFLEMNRHWFYSVRETANGMQYVTARGWEDLSAAIYLYEKKGFPVNGHLVEQYIVNAEIAEEFVIYYGFYRKCKSDYRAEDILAGKACEEMAAKLRKAKPEERFSVLGMIVEELNKGFGKAVIQGHSLEITNKALCNIEGTEGAEKLPVSVQLQEQSDEIHKRLQANMAANNMIGRRKEGYLSAMQALMEYGKELDGGNREKDLREVRGQFGRAVKQHEKQISDLVSAIKMTLGFVNEVWEDRPEINLFFTELTAGAEILNVWDEGV